MKAQTRAERQAQWKLLVDTQLKSGQTQVAFCKEKNISLVRFSYYAAKFKVKPLEKRVKPAPLFSPVHFKKNEPLESEIRITLPNGFHCALASSIDKASLKRLLEVLLSC